MKLTMLMLVVLLVVSPMIGCSGGGGDSGGETAASADEDSNGDSDNGENGGPGGAISDPTDEGGDGDGKTKGVSGTFNITTTVTDNSCVGDMETENSMVIVVKQEGSKIYLTDEEGDDQGSGTVDGNSFTAQFTEPAQELGDSCTLAFVGTINGEVSGDDMTGNLTVEIDFNGDCGEMKDCTMKASMIGKRQPEAAAQKIESGKKDGAKRKFLFIRY